MPGHTLEYVVSDLCESLNGIRNDHTRSNYRSYVVPLGYEVEEE